MFKPFKTLNLSTDLEAILLPASHESFEPAAFPALHPPSPNLKPSVGNAGSFVFTMAEKEATVYIVDVARSMSKSHGGRDVSDLEWSLQYVWEKITNTVSTDRKTALMGVVGLGTDKTGNQMEEDDAYKHISILQPIQQFKMPELRRLSEQLRASNTDNRDALSAIIIAVDMITQHCKKLKYVKKIVLVTNGTGQIDGDDVDAVAQQINNNDIQLVILGVDFDDPEMGLKEEGKPSAKAQNERTLKSLVDQCVATKSMFGTMQEAIDGLSNPQVKPVRPTPTYRGTLRLGDPNKFDTAISIDVERYFKTSIRRPPTASAYAVNVGRSQADTKLGAVHNEYTYTVKDDNERDGLKHLKREDLAKGYEYGRAVVHISETDENITKLQTEAGYEIIGFIPAENVERYCIIDNSNMLVSPKQNDKAALALSSLIQALHINNSVAVARLVKKNLQEPQVTLLSPLVTGDYQCLVENILPFAEDIRTYRFPPLDKVLTVSGKALNQHRNLPNDDLVKSMSDYVDSMSLDRDDEEMLEMDETYSPVLHTIEGAVRYRAVYPDASVPPKREAFMAYSKQPEELQVQSQEALRRLVKAADVKKVSPRVKGRRYREPEKPLSNLDVNELLRKEKRTKISSDNAISEFKQMLDRAETTEVIEDAVKQMGSIVEERIRTTFGEDNHDRILEELGVMRSMIFELEMPALYNDFIRDLKAKSDRGELEGDRGIFWSQVNYGSLGPITKAETDLSEVTQEDAKALMVLRKAD